MQASILSDAIVAGAIVAYLAFTAIKGAHDYKQLKTATKPEQRLSFYRKWGIELIVLTIAGVIALAMTGRSAYLIAFPQALAPLHDFLSGPIIWFWLCFAAFCVLMLISSISVMRLTPNEANAARAKKILTATPMLGRDAREWAWGTLMSLFAGAGEEIVFRLLFPIVLFSLTHSLVAAVLIAVVAFGIGHAYQGLAGVIMTAAIGALMFGIYAATRSLWLVAAFHAVVDLRAIVILGAHLAKLARVAPAAPCDPALVSSS